MYKSPKEAGSLGISSCMITQDNVMRSFRHKCAYMKGKQRRNDKLGGVTTRFTLQPSSFSPLVAVSDSSSSAVSSFYIPSWYSS
mmetsp:Transcript_58704/g.174695  ORF Transcript_58704/g.174695 Transcript_58704/m.174695 type:complete len:84 (+) Transcript_58704:148-399(+)